MNNFEKLNNDEIFYKNLLEEAFKEIDTLTTSENNKKLVMVCGSIRGKDSAFIEENIKILQEKIKDISENEDVFDQTKYEETKLKNAPHKLDLKMEIFYRGIITSGKISRIYVLPGWEQSEGTKKEISYAKEVDLPIIYL